MNRSHSHLRLSIVLLLIGVAAASPSAAATNVPDPLWIGGVYDGADTDEAFDLLSDAQKAQISGGVLFTLLIVGARLLLCDDPLRLALSLSTPHLRSPPGAA